MQVQLAGVQVQNKGGEQYDRSVTSWEKYRLNFGVTAKHWQELREDILTIVLNIGDYLYPCSYVLAEALSSSQLLTTYGFRVTLLNQNCFSFLT